MCILHANIVGERLGLSARMIDWLDQRTSPAGTLPPVLPDDDAARSYLAELDIGPDSWQEILATRPDTEAHPELWWVIERAYHDLVGNLGNCQSFRGWPSLPVSGSAQLRHLYVWVFLAAVPIVRRYHAEHGIPDTVSWGSLRSVGHAVRESRALFGTSGLLFDLWVQPLAFRGVHYSLGRLAYDLGGSAGSHFDGVDLSVHIGGGRPLRPIECDESFEQAIDFFREHFPERPVRGFKCHSWLLDHQLTEYLPESSNIVQFQRRFRLVHDEPTELADNVILEYVFNRIHADAHIGNELLDALPQVSSLERAFVSHLRAGKHWYSRTGWLPATAIGALGAQK